MKTRLIRRCERCNGTGTVRITGVYAETYRGLKLVARAQGWVVANRDADWFGCSGPALSNRLARLEGMGLAKSETVGRERRYVAV